MRQVVLDTETTGLEAAQGHRIIEIGCVELVNRRRTQQTFHLYVNPEREVDEAAMEVHGLSLDMLADKPRFAEIASELIEFLADAELIIHNAEFDLGFLNTELRLAGIDLVVQDRCEVIDTLILARQLHPGQRNSLDALCKRYHVDNSGRDLHGALLDAQLLADVYLAMTGGQGTLSLDASAGKRRAGREAARRMDRDGLELPVVRATRAELAAHDKYLDMIDAASPTGALWRKLDS